MEVSKVEVSKVMCSNLFSSFVTRLHPATLPLPFAGYPGETPPWPDRSGHPGSNRRPRFLHLGMSETNQ